MQQIVRTLTMAEATSAPREFRLGRGTEPYESVANASVKPAWQYPQRDPDKRDVRCGVHDEARGDADGEINTPAIADPMMRDRLNCVELSANARPTCSWVTIDGTMD
jgi:hypothetical protein